MEDVKKKCKTNWPKNIQNCVENYEEVFSQRKTKRNAWCSKEINAKIIWRKNDSVCVEIVLMPEWERWWMAREKELICC